MFLLQTYQTWTVFKTGCRNACFCSQRLRVSPLHAGFDLSLHDYLFGRRFMNTRCQTRLKAMVCCETVSVSACVHTYLRMCGHFPLRQGAHVPVAASVHQRVLPACVCVCVCVCVCTHPTQTQTRLVCVRVCACMPDARTPPPRHPREVRGRAHVQEAVRNVGGSRRTPHAQWKGGDMEGPWPAAAAHAPAAAGALPPGGSAREEARSPAAGRAQHAAAGVGPPQAATGDGGARFLQQARFSRKPIIPASHRVLGSRGCARVCVPACVLCQALRRAHTRCCCPRGCQPLRGGQHGLERVLGCCREAPAPPGSRFGRTPGTPQARPTR